MNRAASQTQGHAKTNPLQASGILQRKCACGNHTIAGGKCEECGKKRRLGLQTKLTIGEPGDVYEQEADRIADQVMAVPARHAVSGPPLRIQRFAGQPIGQIDVAPASVDQALVSPGRPLEPALRQDVEQRFGYDFSRVRVHTDTAAEQSAQDVNALAYTLGHNIVFGGGQFSPESHRGTRLLAHELTHVVQQEQDRPIAVRRTLAANSSCPPNTHGAPADPIGELTADDERAQLMALGTSNVLALEALTFADPTFGRSYVSDAYERRFGLPPAAAGGRFRNRFTGRPYATQNVAMREEMLSLSDRFRTLHNFLSGPIRYRCPGTSSVTLPGCAAATCGGSIAFSCPGGRQIAICPTFWNFPLMQTVDQRGGNMIHESVHMRLGFRPHNLGSVDQRGRNPECYAALVADIYGFQSDDTTDCTPLIP